MKRAAVVGGGYAGIAAAVTLTGHGIACDVFESARTLGGRARRIDYRGETLDNGQHILSGAYDTLTGLMRKVGVSSAAIERRTLSLSMPPDFHLQAPRLPAPLHMAWALLTARGLAWNDRIGAVRLMRHLQRDGFRVDSSATVAQFLALHRQPTGLISRLWRPLTVAALNTPIETASAQIFANVLRDALAASREASDLLLPRTDLTSLFPAPAAQWLMARGCAIHTGRRVRSIAQREMGFEVTDDTNTAHYDAVILAIGPHQFEAIALPAEINAPRLDYEPIVTVYFRFDTEARLPRPMLGQEHGIAQWFFDRGQLDMKPAQGNVIAAVISASGPHLDWTGEELAAQVLRELSAHVASLPAPRWHKVVTEKFATFACTPAAAAYRPPTLTAIPGLFLAGDYVACDYPATLEGAARNGVAAGQAVAQHFSV